MNRKRYLTILSFLFVFRIIYSQTGTDSGRISLGYPIYSQYLQNGLMINPAYTGSREALSAFLSYRMQWMGTNGAPVIQSASIHSPMKNDRVALGLKAQFMKYGVTKSTSIYASYAYHLRVGKGKLSLGLNAGVDISNTDYSGLLLINSGDPVFTVPDKPYTLPNAGAGLYYFSEKLFAGFSIPTFLSYRETDTGTPQAYHSFNEYDLLFTAGGVLKISDLIKVKPSVLVDYALHKTEKMNQLDLNMNLIFADLLWVGGSWRTSEEVFVGILQVQINPQFMFGFSYDYPAGRLNSFSKGSSEFILRYEFGSKVSTANPRYF